MLLQLDVESIWLREATGSGRAVFFLDSRNRHFDFSSDVGGFFINRLAVKGGRISKHFVRYAMYKPCTSLQACTCPLFVLRVMGAKHILISLAFCACSINPVLSDSPSVEPVDTHQETRIGAEVSANLTSMHATRSIENEWDVCSVSITAIRREKPFQYGWH